MNPPLSLQAAISQSLGEHFPGASKWTYSSVGGGSINDAYRIYNGEQTIFCKINSATKFPHLFRKESEGLQLLAKENKIKTPAVVACFEAEGYQVLLLQWIEEGSQSESFWKTFGEQLAALHHASDQNHGLNEDNYMGSVPQANRQHRKWCVFFAAERLTPMIERCAAKHLLSSRHIDQFGQIQKKLSIVFDEEPPSLLHGDLWSGNFLCSNSSEPILIDPAVYFGHRSMDLAMTTLFGGFRQPFYDAYHYHFPLPANHQEQWDVCNLYPLLIHLYLFGSGYLPQIERTLKQFT